MGNAVYKTDHAAREVYAKRMRQSKQRGDKYMGSPATVLVPFHSNFDEFAAKVAAELRHKIVYRTDGGRFARGLVRASGDLKLIHEAYMAAAAPPPDGVPVRLNAMLFRRKDPMATNRWVMSVRFNAPDWIFEDEGDVVVASAGVLAQGRENAMNHMLDHAVFVAQEIQGEPGKRIRKMVEMAEEHGYPRNAEFWHYNRLLVEQYTNFWTGDQQRQYMSHNTQGRLPFDGWVAPYGEWRRFPFRTLAAKCSALDAADCQSLLRAYLLDVDKEIYLSLAHANKQANRAAAGGGAAHSTLASGFIRHLKALQSSKDHLYSAYK